MTHGQIVQTTCPTITSATNGVSDFTQLGGNAQVIYYGSGATGGAHNVSATNFLSFYQSTSWPGQYFGMIAQPTLANNRYISLQFAVPAGYMAGSP